MCLLLLPLQVMSSDEGAKAAPADHGGKPAEHGGKPAASKELAGNEAPAES